MSLPTYPAYDESRTTYVDSLPEHWSTPPLYLRYQADLGKMLDSSRITGNSLMPYLRNVDVQWGRINFKDLPEMDIEEGEVRRYTVTPGDLLVCEGGEVGRAAVVSDIIEPIAFQKALHRLRAIRSDESPAYMFYVLRWAADVGAFSNNGQSTIAHLTGEQLRKYRFPCPPLVEQLAIAAFLDRETAKINALIAEQEKLIVLLAEKRQATISCAVTRGLDPNVPLKDSGVPWLGKVPAHWDVTRLKFVANVQTGIAKGKDVSNKENITVPYLRVANVQDGYLALEDIAMIEIEPEQLARYRLQVGDVLMNEGGDFDKLGRGAIWQGEIPDCIHQNHVFAVRPHSISPDWLNQLTSSNYAQFYFMTRSKQSTNLASISSSNIMEMPVLMPSDCEQAAILAFITKANHQADQLMLNAKSAINLLKERRAALISATVTGKIDVRGLAA